MHPRRRAEFGLVYNISEQANVLGSVGGLKYNLNIIDRFCLDRVRSAFIVCLPGILTCPLIIHVSLLSKITI